jgi:purine-binding chemotaxis protein CheW
VSEHLTIRVAGADYAVAIASVREVMRVGPITRVPHAPEQMRGLTTLRGRVIPVIDAGVALDQRPTPLGHDARILVVASGQRLIGMLVDRVGGVIEGTAGASTIDVDAIARAA